MQTPSASDSSFKAFLDKLQEQNNRGFLTQLFQLRTEREIAGEDDDKREEQLDEVISSLKEVKVAVTGVSIDVDISPLVNIGENQTRLLEELSKESALTRKLTEGSVEYDKAAAQYRNTSGREIESLVTGKVSKKGGFLDFETARDITSGQGNRVREANKISLKPINYVPGRATAVSTNSSTSNVNNSSTTNNTESKSFFKYLGDEIESGVKYFLSQGLSAQSGDDMWQKPKDVEKKERAAKVSSDRQKPVSANPESDNIVTSQEAIADVTKTDLEVTKEILTVAKEQLIELQYIKDALAPSTPKGLIAQRSKPGEATITPNTGLGIPSLPLRTPSIPSKVPTPAGTPPGAPAAASAALTAGTLATVAVGGAATTYAATGLLAAQEEHRKAYSAEQDKTGMLGALSGDTGIAANILDANQGKTPEEVRAAQAKKAKALENAPWYTRMYGIGETEYLKQNPLSVEGVSTEQASLARSNYATVDPRRVDTAGKTVASTSVENVDMGREHLRGGGNNSTLISNNVNNSNTTKYVPMKASPRPEYSGSALDRYQDRISAY